MNKQKIEVAISVARMLYWVCRFANEAIVLVHALINCQPF